MERTDWNDDFIEALYKLRHFADKYQVLGPITLRLQFSGQRDSEYFKVGLKKDCRELYYNMILQSNYNIDKFEMCGMKIEIEHQKE